MERTRKISIRKILQTLLTLTVVAGCVLAVTSANKAAKKTLIRTVDIRITNSKQLGFLDEQLVKELLLKNRHIDFQAMAIETLDLHQMENIARSNPWVSDAEVFIDNQHDLHIRLTQRKPVLRIFQTNGNSYYIDSMLNVVPLSTRYVHYTPVITGMPPLNNDSIGQKWKAEALYLSSRIEKDPFWKAQVTQININNEGKYELIPVLGKHHILLGDTSRLEEKLTNLLSFYKNVLNKVGWDRYELLDARFAGQVVASPAIQWKVPVDRALSNMNWVQAIIENSPKEPEAANQGDLETPAAPAPSEKAKEERKAKEKPKTTEKKEGKKPEPSAKKKDKVPEPAAKKVNRPRVTLP